MMTQDERDSELSGEPRLTIGGKIIEWAFAPAVIGIVRSTINSAVEADIDDYDLMQYYSSHPETDRRDTLAERANRRPKEAEEINNEDLTKEL